MTNSDSDISLPLTIFLLFRKGSATQAFIVLVAVFVFLQLTFRIEKRVEKPDIFIRKWICFCNIAEIETEVP